MTAIIAANKRMRDAADQQWQRKAVDCVTVDLPHPISTNRLHMPNGRGGMVKTPRYRRWKNQAGQMLQAQRPGRVEGSYAITIVVGRKHTRIDLGNAEKACSDLLQEHGVIKNDSKAVRIVSKWSDEIEGCRVTVRRAT